VKSSGPSIFNLFLNVFIYAEIFTIAFSVYVRLEFM
jgi:hypothetical protein